MESGVDAIAVSCRGLTKRYSNVLAVDGLDLTIKKGECFGLLGPNGAGKTTTVEILEGLTKPDGGTVEILGFPWTRKNAPRLRSYIGVALQETRLPEKLTVLESVRLFRSFYRHGRSVDEVITLLGLDEKRNAWVGKLSGGQRQRLALASALVASPDILFLDEPTTGLDPQARIRIWEVVRSFLSDGGTVILTTHYMEEAHRLCDRIAILDQGRKVAEDTPDALIESLGADQVIEFNTNNHVVTGLGKLPGVVGSDKRGHSYILRVEHLQKTLPALLSKAEEESFPIESMTTHRASLEDVYVHLTGRGLRDG
jgi:ABC-2 type transport system ATP-binding protein